jgi:folate-dependent phosphoribosylglycinamide formyltransferase PurN
VISNRADAYGLERARDAGIDTRVLDHKAYEGREAFDTALIELIDAFAPKLVVLAGFMRILTPGFVRHYHGRLLNIHPSLLPCIKGCTLISACWKPAIRCTAAACISSPRNSMGALWSYRQLFR